MQHTKLQHRIHNTVADCAAEDVYTDVVAAFAKIQQGNEAYLEADDEAGNVYTGVVTSVDSASVTIRGDDCSFTVAVVDVEAVIFDSDAENEVLLLMKKSWVLLDSVSYSISM